MNIGTRLRELRAARGFSQGDIERRTGLLRCYTSRLENGHSSPSLETLEKLAAALEVEMYQLFFEGKGKPQPISPRVSAKLGSQERWLIDTFKNFDKGDGKVLVAMARKMTNRKRTDLMKAAS
ncbi:MAG TPA: helix-turn-helix domain-containing protein [Terriglobia bacterium]|nr:helix-turn-helix domain-containing protein [Terriglobia bacterium]